jgi:transposase-like protein
MECTLRAVRLADQVGVAQAAKDLGVEAGMIRYWRLAARDEGADAFRGQGNRTALEAELDQPPGFASNTRQARNRPLPL